MISPWVVPSHIWEECPYCYGKRTLTTARREELERRFPRVERVESEVVEIGGGDVKPLMGKEEDASN